MKALVKYLLLMLLFISCEKQTDWEIKAGTDDLLIVEGMITNELKEHTIRLSKPTGTLNGNPQPVSDAVVVVSSGIISVSFHEDPLNPGTYLSDRPFIGLKNNTYSLLISQGGNTYTSKAVLAPPAEFIFLRYQKSVADGNYYITWVSNPYSPVQAAMYEIQLDWSSVNGYEDEDPDSCRAKLFYYTLPTLDVSEVFAPTLEKISFPPGTVITERRYSLTDEHAAYLRAMLLETTWQGGFFNTAAANVPTNLSEGAAGFFSACGVIEKQETAP